jgi:peptidyl-prolyl cis-trans isomerase A (cyclophilin A)
MHVRRSYAMFVGFPLALLVMTGVLRAQSTQKSTAHRPTHRTAAAARRSLLRPASLNEKAPEVYRAKFATTQGDFVIEVTRAWAPQGADRFYNLVKNGFFTDASFFRVVPGFVVQFGVPAKPAIARAWAHANIKDDPVKQSNAAGYVTYAAASAPNTRNTQVFINLRDNSSLDGQGFAPFGRVVEGLDVVSKFYGGYGDGPPFGSGPDQEKLTNEGKAYVDKNFPKLDSIKSAVIVKPAGAGSAAPKKPGTGR